MQCKFIQFSTRAPTKENKSKARQVFEDSDARAAPSFSSSSLSHYPVGWQASVELDATSTSTSPSCYTGSNNDNSNNNKLQMTMDVYGEHSRSQPPCLAYLLTGRWMNSRSQAVCGAPATSSDSQTIAATFLTLITSNLGKARIHEIGSSRISLASCLFPLPNMLGSPERTS